MLNTVKNWFIPPVFEDEEKTRIARITYIILLTVLGVAIAFPVIQLIMGLDAAELQFSTTLSAVAVIVILFLLWTLRRGWVRISSLLIPLLMLSMYSSLLMRPDVPKPIIMGYATVIIIAGLLLGKRGIIVFAVLAITSLITIFVIQRNQPTGSGSDFFAHFENLPTIIANLIMVSVLYYVAISSLSGSLQRLRLQETALNERNLELQAIQGTLEERVATRTASLETVTTLSERLNAILDLDTLLVELVNQVKERFNYYHTHVYLIDEVGQNLVMAAGAGEAGQRMKAQGHSIPLNAATSLVARAARINQIVDVSEVRTTPNWLPNPLLPDTQAEMAVPIVLEGRIVGVLDVQQDRVAALDEGDASVLRSVANQVAVAIRNARAFAKMEAALTEANITRERYLAQSWSRVGQGVKEKVYMPSGEFNLTGAAQAKLNQQTASQPEPVIIAVDDADTHAVSIVAPVTLSGKTIGTLQAYQVGDGLEIRPWTENELAFVQVVLDQVAQTAENLRLFDETRQRADFERTVGEITQKIRQAPNLEALTQTAADILNEVLGTASGEVYLNLSPQVKKGNGHGR